MSSVAHKEYSAEAEVFRTELKRANSVLIGTHLNPDGDALGSALALSLYFDSIGLRSEVVCHHPPPRNLRFLPSIAKLRTEPKNEKFDLGILLDLESKERLGGLATSFESIGRLMVIDHHVPHESPGDVRIIDVSAGATALILTRLFLAIGAPISSDMATCLLTGIVTDTGSFRFRNTTPEALSLSAVLLQRGADISLVNEEVFQSKPLSSTRLLGRVLHSMKLSSEDRLAWSVVTARDFNLTQSKDEDTEGFVNELLFIDTVRIATLLREIRPGTIRCSIRSRGDYDVAEVAREFNGGGHRNAAGCTFEVPLREAEQMLIDRLKRCLASF